MGQKSNIEWTDDTDNIIVAAGGGWWCRKISPGCAHCYAARINEARLFGGNGRTYSGQPPPLVLREDLLAGWARQTRPRLHFVASMTDVFGEWVPRGWQFKMLDAMAAAPSQIFQVLTKRPEIMRETVEAWVTETGRDQVPRNIWLGCSVENQEWADARCEAMAALAAIPAVTFVSYEPALGPVNWRGWGFLDWIISGGESGTGARPSHPDWHRATRDFCAANDIAYFFKQWGEWGPEQPHECESCHFGNHQSVYHVGKKHAGRVLDGRTHDEFPCILHPALRGRKQIHCA